MSKPCPNCGHPTKQAIEIRKLEQKVIAYARLLPEQACKNVGNFKTPHCNVCGFYEALSALEEKRSQEP